MSSPRVLRPPATSTTESNGVAKRGRKARPSCTDDDKQRERKRAMDRKAQRVSREKTRSHIAHLEKMVEILCEKNESEATTELMAEVSRLNAEIDRLRKIIETIKSVLRADSFEMESQGRTKGSSNGSRSGSQNRDAADELKSFVVPEPKAPQQPPQQQHHPVFDDTFDSPPPEQQHSHKRARTASFRAPIEEAEISPRQQPVQPPKPEFPEPHPTLNFTPAWSSAVIPRRRAPHNRSMSVSHVQIGNGTLGNQLFSQLYPSIPASVSTCQAPPTTLPCRIWQKSNRIYAKMFSIKKNSRWAADQFNTGTLFKAVKEGWGAVDQSLQRNPVLDILREIDVDVFPRLDRATRTALMIKSHLLMKYFLNSDEKNWSLMPTWQRPVPSQSSLQHPIAIDFFAWPGLRDRLVSHHAHYFANPPKSRQPKQTSWRGFPPTAPAEMKDDPTAGIADFSVAYQHHFRFSWPFTFDDAYLYDRATGEYSISPMFERYHSDLKYWGVEPVFFEKFPELKGVMSVAHSYDPVSCEGPARAVSPIDSDSTPSPPSQRVEELSESVMSGGLPPSDRRGSTAHSTSTTSSGSPPSPEEVYLGDMGEFEDIEMMEGLDGTLGKAEDSGELTFNFSPGGQTATDANGKVVYEGADAYMMELFNDLPCVV